MDYSSQLRNWERHREFQAWQDAMTMTLIFGDRHLHKMPSCPKEYEAFGKVWLQQQSELVNRSRT